MNNFRFAKNFVLKNKLLSLAILIVISVIIGIILFSQTNQTENTIEEVNTQVVDEIDKSKDKQKKDENKESKPNSKITPPKKVATFPAQLLDLVNWKVTLPIDTSYPGSPDEIEQPALATFANKNYFFSDMNDKSVVFRAYADGATTGNSQYPRSELREMTNSGKNKASWSSSNGRHRLDIKQSITVLPSFKPELVSAQVHDGSNDVIMIKIEGRRLFVEVEGNEVGLLDSSYSLGTIFDMSIVVEKGHFVVYYNGAKKVTYTKNASGLYFKTGSYVQTNTDKGDNPDAFGEVRIYDLKLQHS